MPVSKLVGEHAVEPALQDARRTIPPERELQHGRSSPKSAEDPATWAAYGSSVPGRTPDHDAVPPEPGKTVCFTALSPATVVET